MMQTAKPGLGQGKGGGRPRREGEVVQVRLALPGKVYRDLEGQANRDALTMWEVVTRLVEGAASAFVCPQAAPSGGRITRAMIIGETRRLLHAGMGLCFVPDLVMSLLQHENLPEVHAALYEAVRAGAIELRPEASPYRLSALELALCPRGLQETWLSWARSM